jgi:hypothetical protein
MTEGQWERCADPYEMLQFLDHRGRERKLRLFAVGCCRRAWHLLTDERSRNAVEVSELFADRGVTKHELAAARTAAEVVTHVGWFASVRRWLAAGPSQTSNTMQRAAQAAASAAIWRVRDAAAATWVQAANALTTNSTEQLEEQGRQCGLLRDLIGNPIRPVSWDPAWRNHHAVAVARSLYDTREFQDMPILADALEEAGCTDEAILSHCRGPGPHVRGCWVVDLVLGKE